MADSNIFILLTGPSGSGKTTIANKLYQLYGLTQIYSYTTRPKRNEDDREHTFITDEEFDKLGNLVGYTEYNGYRYCATEEQVESNDIYVIDVPGIEYFKEHYKGDKTVIIISLEIREDIRLDRLVKRDGREKALERIEHDAIIHYQESANQHAHHIIFSSSDKATNEIYLLFKYYESARRFADYAKC